MTESPHWLCEMNEFIVPTGDGVMWRLQGDDDGKMMEEWLLAAQRLTEFCARVRSES